MMRGLAILAAAATIAACNLGESVGLEAGSDEPTGEPRGDEDGSGSGDAASVDGGPGEITLVVSGAELLDERLCDLDGDGLGDNAVADLGSPGSTLFASAVTAIFQSGGVEKTPLMLHVPEVDDLAGPDARDATMVFVRSNDPDDDPSDNFSGEESFVIRFDSLDACGEPRNAFRPLQLSHGEVEASEVDLEIPGTTGFVIRGADAAGTFRPGGSEAVLTFCGYTPIRDLGHSDVIPEVGMTILETLLAGGAPFGIPGVEGLAPDLDIDGDGLERFETDGEGHVVGCIDGDSTVITGRDCWHDERIADAFSITVRVSAVSGRLAGRDGAYSTKLGEQCTTPPAESLWPDCEPAPEVGCRRNEWTTCETECGTEGMRACPWDCSTPGACRGFDVDTEMLDSCDGAVLEGSARCGGGDSLVVVADSLDQAGAARLGRSVSMGTGLVVAEATVRVSRSTSDQPGGGWALVAYVDHDGALLGEAPGLAGVDTGAEGAAVVWSFSNPEGEPVEEDKSCSIGLTGAGGAAEGLCEWWKGTQWTRPSLDSSTEGTIEQTLRLALLPNLLETAEDERAAAGILVGPFTTSVVRYHDAGELPSLDRGDVVTVGVVARTEGEHDAVIELVDFSVTAYGLCP